jgi:thiamine biosynthesis lipoprotein ApbE
VITCARVAGAALVSALAGCGSDAGAAARQLPDLRELTGPTMGSSWTLKWHGGAGPERVRALVDQQLAAADAAFSTWHTGSELAAFNAHASTVPFRASGLLRAAVAAALDAARATDGAFDPTVKPLSDLYRAQRDGGAAPTAAALAQARERVGWQRVRVDGETLVKERPDLALDLDGIVAGFVADRLAPALAELDVRNFMLDLTGEVLCRGMRPDGAPWCIGIVDPLRAVPGAERSLFMLPLVDRALCTSSDHRTAASADGELTHVFDPRTGSNPAHGIASVSVLARSCALADALATALLVLGPDGAAPALQRCGEDGVGAWFEMAAPDGSLRGRPVGWPDAFAADGRLLRAPPLADDVRQQRERELAAAETELARVAADGGDDVAATVWVGRRLAYLQRWRDAIAVYTRGLQAHPDEPHLLRHRGHRWLTVREFESARDDLLRAWEVTRGLPDEIEPDGQPEPGRPPHSTLQGNIAYHLGLAQLCLGDFAAAARAFGDALALARNDEMRVAAAHWRWCAAMRCGDEAAARAAVAPLQGDLDVVENRGYWQLCRVYRGDLDAGSLTAFEGSKGAVLAFGLAHLAAVRREPGAAAALMAVAQRPDWPSFGVMVAEAACRWPPLR